MIITNKENDFSKSELILIKDEQRNSNSLSFEKEENKDGTLSTMNLISSEMVYNGIQKIDEFKLNFVESYWEDTAHMLNSYISSLVSQLRLVLQLYIFNCRICSKLVDQNSS